MTTTTETEAEVGMLPTLRAEIAELKAKIEDAKGAQDRAMAAMRTRRAALEGKGRRVEDDKGWQEARQQNQDAVAAQDKLTRQYDLVRLRENEALRVAQQHQARLARVDDALAPWRGVIEYIEALDTATVQIERAIGASTSQEITMAVNALRTVRASVVHLPRRLLDERASLAAELQRLGAAVDAA